MVSVRVRPLGGAGMGSKRVELFAAIRFDWQRNRMSVRSLARKNDVHRRTVRQAIASPLPLDEGPGPGRAGARGGDRVDR